MRTTKFHDVAKELIDGPCSSPIRIHRDSHAIQKSSSFPTLSPSPSHNHHLLRSSGKPHGGSPAAAKRLPVIIYTQSPKIIHTQAHDFMALVQKLTGLDRAEEDLSDEGSISISNDDKECADNKKNKFKRDVSNYKNLGYEENDSLSGVTDDKLIAHDSSVNSSMYKVHGNSNNNNNSMNNSPCLMDVPYSDFLCSPSRASSMFQGHPISPSFMDFVKGFPEY